MKAIQLTISGRVQNVGYRRWFENQANKLGVKGYVKNLDTGDVEALVIGEETTLNILIEHGYIGPLRAEVQNIQQKEIVQFIEYTDFKMLR
nr:acylphosphatase [Acinetobacter sp. Marseille-Q1620]